MTDQEIIAGLLRCDRCPIGAVRPNDGRAPYPRGTTEFEIARAWDSMCPWKSDHNPNGYEEALEIATAAGLRDKIVAFLESVKA